MISVSLVLFLNSKEFFLRLYFETVIALNLKTPLSRETLFELDHAMRTNLYVIRK